MFVPHVKELGGPVAQSGIRLFAVAIVRLKIFQWRTEGVFEFRQIPVNGHFFRRPRRHATNAVGELCRLSGCRLKNQGNEHNDNDRGNNLEGFHCRASYNRAASRQATLFQRKQVTRETSCSMIALKPSDRERWSIGHHKSGGQSTYRTA